MTQAPHTLGRRIGTAVACAALVGSTAVVATPAAQAATPTVLTMSGASVSGQNYAGTQPQSFRLVRQGDGSWGVRNTYTGRVLSMNGSSVTGEPYKGTQPQSFHLVKQGDGSRGIRNAYSGRALNMSGSSISGQKYSGRQPQSFQLVKQGDGSWGIRAFYGGDRLPQEPRAKNDAAITEAGAATTVDVLGNDQGTGTRTAAGLRPAAVTGPEHGTAAIKDGKVVYTPAAGHTGCDSFRYTVTDELGQPSTAAVHVATGAVNDSRPGRISGTALIYYGSTRVPQQPVARDDAAQARPDAPVAVDVLANDSSGGSATSQGLRVTAVAAPANGTAAIKDGKVVYTPNSGFSGCDSFPYTVTDSRGRTSAATVSVVTPAK